MTDSVTPSNDNADIAAINDKAELLAQLRDIQVPEVSAWPAPGWWVLGFLIVCLFITGLLVKQRRQHYAQNAWRREALEALSELEKRLPNATDAERHRVVQEASALLRRVMMLTRGRGQVAGLTSDAWLNELNTQSADYTLDKTLQPLLTDVPYQPVPNALATPDNVNRLLAWMQQTIRSLPSARRRSAPTPNTASNAKPNTGAAS